MTYLSHTASFHSNERIAPSNRGIKHLDAFIGFNYNHTSGTRGTLGFTPQLDIPGYDLLGLQAGLHSADDAWRVMLWAKNLTNEYYLLGANRNGETLVGFTGMPRTFGLTGTVRFR